MHQPLRGIRLQPLSKVLTSCVEGSGEILLHPRKLRTSIRRCFSRFQRRVAPPGSWRRSWMQNVFTSVADNRPALLQPRITDLFSVQFSCVLVHVATELHSPTARPRLHSTPGFIIIDTSTRHSAVGPPQPARVPRTWPARATSLGPNLGRRFAGLRILIDDSTVYKIHGD